jgi:hypothetical protein
MSNEAEIYDTILGRDHQVPLFCDLSHADEATIHGGKCVVLGQRPISHRDGNHKKNGISSGYKFTTLL